MGATTNYQENISVDQGAHVSTHRYHGSVAWTGPCSPDFPNFVRWGFRSGPNTASWSQIEKGNSFADSATFNNYTHDEALSSDVDRVFRAYLFVDCPPGPFTVLGDWIGFRSYAVTAAADGVAFASLITASTARITANFFPNTNASTATVKMQYRAFGSGTWLDAPGGTSPYTGYLTQNIFRDLTGLAGSTTYEFRFLMTRDTAQTDTLNGPTYTFVTLAAAPETPVTVAASSVSHSSATLNGTIDPNTIVTRVRFGWGTSDAGAGTWANYTAYQAFSGDGSQAFSAGISGLAASTAYFFRALVEYPSPGFGTTLQGDTLSFTTSSNPLAEAAEAEMLPIQDFDRKYGVATTIFFVVPAPAGSSSNLFYTGAPVWAGVGECKISKVTGGDTPVAGAFTDTDSDPAQVGTQLYSLALTAIEMQCDQAFIVLTELGATAARDVLLRVRTHQQLGSVDIDSAAGQKANTSAFKVVGYQAGHGIEAIGGATGRDIDGIMAQHFVRVNTAQTHGVAAEIKLDAGAVATNDFYNSLICDLIAGTGAGQSRVIIDYTSARIATLDSGWSQNPDNTTVFALRGGSRTWELPNVGAELSLVPGALASGGLKLQLLFQRFAFKVTQTAITQTWFQAPPTAVSWASKSVNDDGATQELGALV